MGKRNIGKWLKEVALLLLSVFIFSNIINWVRKPDQTPVHLPEATVTLLDGSRYTFRRGKPLIVHFWATWCRICKMEASNIERLSRYYDVVTIAVNSGEESEIEAYMRRHNLHFRVYNDREGVWALRFHTEVFPSTFIYDADGVLRFSEIGYTTTAGFLARMKMVE
jgi:thiol-disulfide isomerase/thioredoxin